MWKYSYLVISHPKQYYSNYMHKHSKVDIRITMEFLMDNDFVVFGDQSVGFYL